VPRRQAGHLVAAVAEGRPRGCGRHRGHARDATAAAAAAGCGRKRHVGIQRIVPAVVVVVIVVVVPLCYAAVDEGLSPCSHLFV
jgi:hypothetical protein